MKEQEFNNKSILPFLKRMFQFAWRYEKNLFITMLMFAAVVGIIDSFYPFIFSHFMTDCLGSTKINSSQDLLNLFMSPCIQKYMWIILLTIFSVCISVMLFVKSAGTISERVIFHMRKDLFAKLQALPFSYFDKNSSGWLLSRISSDTDRVSEVISWGLIGMAWAIVSIFFCFGAMFSMHWIMSLIVLVSMPIMFFLSVKIRNLILKYSRISRKINSEMIGLINEHIHGVELNKSLANEDKAVALFSIKATEHYKSSYKSAYYSATFFPIIIIVGNIAASSVLGYGAYEMTTQVSILTIGILSSFFIYAVQIFEPIADISNYYSIAQNSMSAGERIFTLLDEPLEKIEENLISNFEFIGAIKFENIDFGYTDEKLILEKFNLEILAGQQVALVGPTGEGKTTIASIMAQFYKPQLGNIFIDDINLNEISMDNFREQVGIVLQQPHVFSGTIAENVRFGKKSISDEEVKSIFIEMGCEDLSNRIDEKVQPDGINLSVGEKQLIAIARVFAYNPKVLILDEATSAIDTITEQRLQLAIKKVLKGRTSIVIAHRLSTIIDSHRILYIKNGAIAEDGNHSQLMEKKGEYWKLNNIVN
jgi:ATP-binding cassette, subfamily B, bacterial